MRASVPSRRTMASQTLIIHSRPLPVTRTPSSMKSYISSTLLLAIIVLHCLPLLPSRSDTRSNLLLPPGSPHDRNRPSKLLLDHCYRISLRERTTISIAEPTKRTPHSEQHCVAVLSAKDRSGPARSGLASGKSFHLRPAYNALAAHDHRIIGMLAVVGERIRR